MLITGLIFSVAYLAIVPIHSPTVRSVHFTRSSVMVFLLCVMLFTPVSVEQVELYHSVFNYSYLTLLLDTLLYGVGIFVLTGFNGANDMVKPEYGMILIFCILGASMMISANDLISMYIALELQSFGLYLLACMRIDLTSSTSASLKYFLLGAISSAFILLGMSLVYQEVGSTHFSNLNAYLETIIVPDNETFFSFQYEHIALILGLLSILCGCMFKISAAPFHSWFSDVIQGVPTYTSIIIINLPKISIFAFLFNFLHHSLNVTSLPSVQTFVMITAIFSLVLGTVAGLMQTKIKRLLAFSTISHVGFLLISVVVGSEAESSLNALTFYITQYTLVTILAFLSLIAYEHFLGLVKGSGVNYIADLQGVGHRSPVLTFTFALCLFSIAGIPPLTGFYAKLDMLNASVTTDHAVIFITAIICSVISAAYYLKVIKVIMFDAPLVSAQSSASLAGVHSYSIAVLTAFMTLFILDPKLIINGTELVALSIYIS